MDSFLFLRYDCDSNKQAHLFCLTNKYLAGTKNNTRCPWHTSERYSHRAKARHLRRTQICTQNCIRNTLSKPLKAVQKMLPAVARNRATTINVSVTLVGLLLVELMGCKSMGEIGDQNILGTGYCPCSQNPQFVFIS